MRKSKILNKNNEFDRLKNNVFSNELQEEFDSKTKDYYKTQRYTESIRK